MSLVLSYKVGAVSSDTWDACFSALNSVPAAGQASVNTQEPFTCRVWVKDALQALHNNHVIVLDEGIAAIEKEITAQGYKYKSGVEGGKSDPQVVNTTPTAS